jgi:lipopolysaccharide/colanic/teichoic acid biosynthesis glycosyltransferase
MTPFPPVSSVVSTAGRVHRLRSTRTRSNEVLFITGYDYFLNKGDLKILLRRYREIILVARTADDFYALNNVVRPLLAQYRQIHLVTNPPYDRQHRIAYELVVRENKSIRISTVSDFCERHLRKLYVPEQNDEDWSLPVSLAPFGPGVRTLKKSLDLTLALVLLLSSLPLWLLSALRIRMQSPGPVFFRQRRVGLNQGEFACLKFRSMRLDAEATGAVFSRRRDPRVFGYGAFMRALRIDELPQLLNVLRGEISLIGPRPERRVFTETFDELIPYYALRHCIKPGITGYAQVRYAYGTGVRDARHKLMYDLYYIKHWSPWLELRIILATVVTVTTQRGW